MKSSIPNARSKTIELTCDGCGTIFTRLLREHKKRIKKGRTISLCKSGCYKAPVERPCENCKNLTTNPKFCSKSCAAVVNGSLFPKRPATPVDRICKVCDTVFSTVLRRTKCPSCFDRRKNQPIHSDAKLGQFVKLKAKSKNFHPSWAFAQVRSLNRQWNASMMKLPCAKCGYSVHVELAHIRGMATFKRSDMLSEINSPHNVVQLCRNCHWELDHGLFPLDSVLAIKEKLSMTGYDGLAIQLQARSGVRRVKMVRSARVELASSSYSKPV